MIFLVIAAARAVGYVLERWQERRDLSAAKAHVPDSEASA